MSEQANMRSGDIFAAVSLIVLSAFLLLIIGGTAHYALTHPAPTEQERAAFNDRVKRSYELLPPSGSELSR